VRVSNILLTHSVELLLFQKNCYLFIDLFFLLSSFFLSFKWHVCLKLGLMPYAQEWKEYYCQPVMLNNITIDWHCVVVDNRCRIFIFFSLSNMWASNTVVVVVVCCLLPSRRVDYKFLEFPPFSRPFGISNWPSISNLTREFQMKQIKIGCETCTVSIQKWIVASS
jgi:hypothetical protein